MHQPIAGVTPPDLAEVTCKVVWPTIAATAAGRLVGRLAASRLGWGEFFTLGKLLAVATIPVSLAVFCWQLMPYVCRRYTLSNRRIIIRKGLTGTDGRWISLEEFDSIGVEVLPGQEWFHAGDLIFRRGDLEVLRLAGVCRPETVRQVCLAARTALLSVRGVAERQAAELAAC
jgi:hypothetical protein